MSIQSNIECVRNEIAAAARTAGRSPDTIRLVAVSKTHPVEAIRSAHQAGQTIFGENRVQEAESKIDACNESLEWHLVGHLQSNKAKIAVQLFELIHSVDSMKLITELNKRARHIPKRQKVLLQVNVSGESSKFGMEPDALPAMSDAVMASEYLTLAGVMTIPPFAEDPERSRPFYARLRDLAETVIAGRGLMPWESIELSMGMSGDYSIAIEEGATLVRVGTAIFGQRR